MKIIKTNIKDGNTTVREIEAVRFEDREDCIFYETELYEAEFPKAITTVTGVTEDTVSITVNWDK